VSRFQLGLAVATPSALAALGPVRVALLLSRHARGDWGDLEPEDKAANEDAIAHGDRILSRYDVGGECYYVISEADRSSTCVMLRSEY